MKKLLIISTLIVMLQGCASPPSSVEQESAAITAVAEARASENYLYYYIAHSYSNNDIHNRDSDQTDVKTDSSGYGHLYTFNGKKSLILSEVVSKMADQLLYNYEIPFNQESIALTSLVDLRDHNNTSWLGQTISEQFFHELHIRKLSVIDYKLMGNIQVTKNGEFGMTRDWKKLKKDVNVGRILTGTLSRNDEGVIVNIRIVNALSNLVESTSSAFIPDRIFVGGRYDYAPKRYISRNSIRNGNESLVRLVE